jgi:hypothetical protein
VSWMGPNVFHVTSTGEVAVLVRLDHRGWHACSSKEEVFDGGIIVARGARGASGKGAVGTESTGERLIIDIAGTRLPCGKPALELLDRFSNAEIEAIRDAMKVMGPDGWYWPVVAGPREDDAPAP